MDLIQEENGEEGEVEGPFSISKLIAKENEDIFTEQDVNIQLNQENQHALIPDEIELLASNSAGVSSLSLNPKLQGWINNNESILHVSRKTVLNPTANNSSILFSAQNSDNLTFVAGTD